MSNSSDKKAMIRRWEAMYNQQQERLERQKKSLDRLVLCLTEANSALYEIADGDLDAGSQRARARRAIDTMSMMIPDSNGKDEDEAD